MQSMRLAVLGSIAAFFLACGGDDEGSTGSPGTGGSSGSGGTSAGGTSNGGTSGSGGSSGGATGGAGGSGGSAGSAGSAGSSSGGSAGAGASGTLITFEQMEASTLPSDWAIGAQSGGAVSISGDTSQNYAQSAGSLKGTYPVADGGVYVWAAYDLGALNLSELYIEFRAKMPAAKQGLKFVKVFGQDSSGYANTTFGLDYTGGDAGSMYQVSFGDGSGPDNDTANVINFDGQNPEWIGRSFGTATVSTPENERWAGANWGTDWHHFRLYVKFNSGTSAANEVADGGYYIEIDGTVYVDAQGIFNRHWSNGPIDRVELFGWAQNGDAPFEVWYDDVRLSTGGFL